MVGAPLRSSVVVVEVVANHHPSVPPSGASIPLESDHLVAVVSTTNGEFNAVTLPSSAALGTVVEIYPGIDGVKVHAPSGENIDGGSSFEVTGDGNTLFRKITATRWGRIGG